MLSGLERVLCPGRRPAMPALTRCIALGQALVSPDGYVLPFEVASVLLLAALIGAIMIAWERK